MKIGPIARPLIVALLAASTFITVAGCSAARRTSTPQPTVGEEAPKKEYQWKDMSTGGEMYRQAAPTPSN